MYKYTKEILERLDKLYGVPRPELEYNSEFELLIAVILSAQCTDKRVNIVTAGLFKKYNTPEQFAELSESELAGMIKSCGLANTKAKNIIAASKLICTEHNAKVPDTIEMLQKLPGVGKKTANVVGSVAFGIPAIAVDTHVHRVSNRLGIADSKTVSLTEKQLREAIPKQNWSEAHHWLIFHGRRVCLARNPKCKECALKDICKFDSQK